MRTMHKPLLKRRTFWKGVIAGAVTMAALVVTGVGVVSALAPAELSHGVRPTWEPTPIYASLSKPEHVTLPPCDTRGKDCTVFDEPTTIKFEVPTWTPFETPTRTVPEPSSLWLTALAAMVAARNTLFAAATAAFVTLGRWLGIKEEDE